MTTSEGHILINSDLEANVPMLRGSIEKLGFKYNDVKILLISHAHWDHNAGSAGRGGDSCAIVLPVVFRQCDPGEAGPAFAPNCRRCWA